MRTDTAAHGYACEFGPPEPTEYKVGQATVGSLPPVVLIARSGQVVLQDYLTPDAARALAKALNVAADEADGVSAPTLFDQLVTEPVPGGARHSDPLSSHLTAADKALRLKWGGQRYRLLASFIGPRARRKGGLTDEQAGEEVGLDHVRATRRLSELRAAGLITPTGVYGVTAAGQPCMTCVVTPAGTAAIKVALDAKTARRGRGA